jgi:hypothetical protein
LCSWAYEQLPEFHRGSTHDIAFITFAFDFFEICARRKPQEEETKTISDLYRES